MGTTTVGAFGVGTGISHYGFGNNWSTSLKHGAVAALVVPTLYFALGGAGTRLALGARTGIIARGASYMSPTVGTLVFANGGSLLLNQQWLTWQQDVGLAAFTFGGSRLAEKLVGNVLRLERAAGDVVKLTNEVNVLKAAEAAKAGEGEVVAKGEELAAAEAKLQEAQANWEALKKGTWASRYSPLTKALSKTIANGIGLGNLSVALNNVEYEQDIRKGNIDFKKINGIADFDTRSFFGLGANFHPDEKTGKFTADDYASFKGFSPFGLVGGTLLSGIGLGGDALAGKWWGKYITMPLGGATVNVIRGAGIDYNNKGGDFTDYLLKRERINDALIGAGVGLLFAFGKAGVSKWSKSILSEESAASRYQKLLAKMVGGKGYNIAAYTVSSMVGGAAARNFGWQKYNNFQGSSAYLIDAVIGSTAGWVTTSAVKWANGIAFGESAPNMEGTKGALGYLGRPGEKIEKWLSKLSPFSYQYSDALKDAIGSDGRVSLGMLVKYAKNVFIRDGKWTLRRIALGSAMGANGGLVAYWLDPNKDKITDKDGKPLEGHTLVDYLLYGAAAGGLLSLLAIARPVLTYWSREDKALSLLRLSTRPDIAVKTSIASAFDFAAMMPMWKLLQAPVDTWVKAGALYSGLEPKDTSKYAGSWSQARAEAFDVNSGFNASLKTFKDAAASGLPTGYKLGPFLGIFTKPLESSTGITAKLSAFYQRSGMRNTIILLSVGQALAEAAIRSGHMPAQMAELKRKAGIAADKEAGIEADKLIASGEYTIDQKSDLVKKLTANLEPNFEKQEVSAMAQSLAFLPLFLLPTAKPQSGDMMRGFAMQELDADRLDRAADFAVLAHRSAMGDASTPEARESILQSLIDIEKGRSAIATAQGNLRVLLTQSQIQPLADEGQKQLDTEHANLAQVAVANENGTTTPKPIEEVDPNFVAENDPAKGKTSTEEVEAITAHLINQSGLQLPANHEVRRDVAGMVEALLKLAPEDTAGREDLLSKIAERIKNEGGKDQDVDKTIQEIKARQAQARVIDKITRNINRIDSGVRALNKALKAIDSGKPQSIDKKTVLKAIGDFGGKKEDTEKIEAALKEHEDALLAMRISIKRGFTINGLHMALANVNDRIRRTSVSRN